MCRCVWQGELGASFPRGLHFCLALAYMGCPAIPIASLGTFSHDGRKQLFIAERPGADLDKKKSRTLPSAAPSRKGCDPPPTQDCPIENIVLWWAAMQTSRWISNIFTCLR